MSTVPMTALDRARNKAYLRLLPLLFLCYVIAYVDRSNVAIAKLTMSKDLPDFDNAVIGFGMGVFFIGYFLLEIPGTLIVERWSARKWISRIMISWGIVAAMTAFVHYRVPVVTDLATWVTPFAAKALAVLPTFEQMLVPIRWLAFIAAIFFLTSMTCFTIGRASGSVNSPSAPGLVRFAKKSFQIFVLLTALILGLAIIPEFSYRGVMTPFVLQFFTVRFLLGLAEAGFFPGVIVYLTHWFPSRDRARALAWFFVATPIAQIISPKISNWMLKFGTDQTIDGVLVHYPPLLGMVGWQWVYVFWGIPAVVLGVLVLLMLTDRPGQAKWLEPDEREALELELKREKALHHGSAGKALTHISEEVEAELGVSDAVLDKEAPASAGGRPHMTVAEALSHPKVLLLAAAYFFIVTGNYGVEFFLPSILKKWYNMPLDNLTWLLILPPIGSLVGQILVGWNSDRVHERRLHAVLPIYFGAAALAIVALLGHPPVWLTVTLFVLAMTGLKAYLPAFWSLPSLFLTEAAAAGSIGLINSVGNLGGFLGPNLMGRLEQSTGSFNNGLLILAASMAISASLIMLLGLGKRVVEEKKAVASEVEV